MEVTFKLDQEHFDQLLQQDDMLLPSVHDPLETELAGARHAPMFVEVLAPRASRRVRLCGMLKTKVKYIDANIVRLCGDESKKAVVQRLRVLSNSGPWTEEDTVWFVRISTRRHKC